LVEALFNYARGSVGRESEYAAAAGSNETMRRKKEPGDGRGKKELWYALTILYFPVDVTRRHGQGAEWEMLGMVQQIESLRDEIADLQGEWFVGIPGKDFELSVMRGQYHFTNYEHTLSHMENRKKRFGG